MEDNPFTQMIKNIRKDNQTQIPAAIRIGTVTSVTPFILDVAGTIQDENSVLKNSLITSFMTGDMLLLVPVEEEQRYIIICKVVEI